MLESRIHAYLRASAARRAQRLGPFLLLLDQHDPGRYFNYAVPDDDLEPTPQDVADLVTAFRARSRIPRLEYLPTVCPALESALVTAGFAVENRVPVLTCPPEQASACEPAGITVLLATTEDELRQAAEVQAEAYGQSTVTNHDVARLRRIVDSGGLVALAFDTTTRSAVGAGQLGPHLGGVSELAAVGVRTADRRRGVATAVSAALTRAAPSVGITTPFLMTLGDAEERVYWRVGYRRAAEMLHISMP